MNVGFTGTKRGMTEAQMAAVFAQLARLRSQGMLWMEHGGCEGADRQAHWQWLGLTGGCLIRPGDEAQAEWAHGSSARGGELVRWFPVKPYLERNLEIARTDVVVAAPRTLQETPRGGTWATVRYARRAGSTVVLCLPDGSVRTEPGERTKQLSLGIS